MSFLADFFSNCDLRKVHEFLLYFVTAVAVTAVFFGGLLRIGSQFDGLKKQIIANLATALPVGAMLTELWLVDEQVILPTACESVRVDAGSMIVWSAGLALALAVNLLLFGKQLRRMGFYVSK